MSGLVGSPSLADCEDAADDTPVHGVSEETEERTERETTSIYARLPVSDSKGVKTLVDGDRTLFVYGAVTGREWRETDDERLVEEFFEEPVATAERTDGTFLLVGVDDGADRLLVATDKLGARSCFLVDDRPAFSTSVAACLPFVDDPTIDEQAVSDFLLMGLLWGTRTLVSEVSMARPATVYEFEDGEWRGERYWKPRYDEADPDGAYLDELASRFRTAVDRTASTLPEEASIWLSGGLDSRNTSSALCKSAASGDHEFETLSAYTYDANPPTGDNIEIAREVADRLGMELTELDLLPSPERIERLVDVCGGMVAWHITKNLSGSYDIEDSNVFMEGVEGSLLGDHLLQSHFSRYNSAVESQIASEAALDIGLVEDCLAVSVDPVRTFRHEAEESDENTFHHKVLDIHFKNYYNRCAMASNAIIRDVGGDRVVYTDGDFLEWCARIPTKYRKGTFPFTTKIPMGTSRAKLGMTKRVAPELADITYERTKLPPKYPYPAHVLGFVANVGLGRLRSEQTYGNGQLSDIWLRMDTDLADWAETYLRQAAERDVFADDLYDLWTRHQRGENLSPVIAHITSLEYWLDTYL
ncbi:asparagine synthase-related protein [Halogeometricum luteum]|uniref:Asparagine synthase-related protein n=1 Tax=Halogeometricum luteum TaxID=2950537 RepID=A0ABU2G0H6_9EURY|nr:asparagine synthase-related protein [Halogeometricum sp. S3BR5-2]MDS0294285.1 asparagine synthase-related protein [Halogeometricum sp. S3BR5-2]